MSIQLYPLFLNLQDRDCIVVGGSEIAERKTREFLDAGARIRLFASEITHQLSIWAKEGKLQWMTRNFATGDLRGAFLVIAASDPETNARIFEEAEMQHTFCNAVDDIPHCSSYAAAVVRRGPLQIAVSTAGNSPALAQRLRKELEEQYGEEYGLWVQQLGERRSVLFKDKAIDSETRSKLLHKQASATAFEIFKASSGAEGSDSQISGCKPDDSRRPS